MLNSGNLELERPTRFWDPSRKLISSIRSYQSGGRFTKKLAVFRHRFWSAITGADIPLNCQIAGGFRLPHPNGVVIHPRAKIGPDCMIFQQVTIGTNAQDRGAPEIGAGVDIGPGAKILGSVKLGDHSRVGANAVVTKNVQPNTTVVGVPAKPIPN